MADENSTGNNLIWAITMIIIVAIIGAALYFLVLKTDMAPKESKVDVEISAPSR
jgi:uncharacterized protein YpmB